MTLTLRLRTFSLGNNGKLFPTLKKATTQNPLPTGGCGETRCRAPSRHFFFILSLCMLLEIHPQNPEERKLKQVVKILEDGGVIIFPTDTIYAIGCLLTKSKAIERVARIKGVKPNKANFSLICSSLSNITDYVKNPDNHTFKVMKRSLPGPYTFILHAGSKIPKFFNNNKKEVGIRVPDHQIPIKLVEICGAPLVTTSIHDEDQLIEYTTDPELIHERYKKEVDLVIHGGFGHNIASTVIDCTGSEPQLVREGLGTVQVL